jgi:hypothetical protein
MDIPHTWSSDKEWICDILRGGCWADSGEGAGETSSGRKRGEAAASLWARTKRVGDFEGKSELVWITGSSRSEGCWRLVVPGLLLGVSQCYGDVDQQRR